MTASRVRLVPNGTRRVTLETLNLFYRIEHLSRAWPASGYGETQHQLLRRTEAGAVQEPEQREVVPGDRGPQRIHAQPESHQAGETLKIQEIPAKPGLSNQAQIPNRGMRSEGSGGTSLPLAVGLVYHRQGFEGYMGIIGYLA